MQNNDLFFMKKAIALAKVASKKGEVPIGAVVVRNGEIISSAYNTRETKKNPIHHAEMKAILKACKVLGGWRLFDCDLYVTLEPCVMCAGAIVNSRIKRVIFGAYDIKNGALGSKINITEITEDYKPEIVSGVMQEECQTLLKNFFSNLRKNKEKLHENSFSKQ